MGEVLRLMVDATSSADLIKGFQAVRNALIVTHVQFADDTLIFCDADPEQIVNVRLSLRVLTFEAVSGLTVNFFNSEVLGGWLSSTQLGEFADLMGYRAGSLSTSHLSLLLCLGGAFKH